MTDLVPVIGKQSVASMVLMDLECKLLLYF